MSEKKLPEYVEDEIDDLQDLSETYGYAQAEHDEDPVNVRAPDNIPREEMAKDLYAAILRYGQEREAAALEKAAKAVSALCFGEIERLNGISADRPHEFKFGPGVQSPRLLALNDAVAAIRALIPKEADK